MTVKCDRFQKKKKSCFETAKVNVSFKIKVGKLYEFTQCNELKTFRGSSLRKTGNTLQKLHHQVNIKPDTSYIEKSKGKQALHGLPQPLGGTWSPQWWGLCGVCSQLPSALPAAQSVGCSPEFALEHTRAQVHTEIPPQAVLAKAAPATECKPFSSSFIHCNKLRQKDEAGEIFWLDNYPETQG